MSLGESKIGYRNAAVGKYYAWNPCGCGCSRGCEGCWAREGAKRGLGGCDDCKKFKVHFHDERLEGPEKTRRPGVVLANFWSDWLDDKRPWPQVEKMLGVMMGRAPWRHYVTLTHNAARLWAAMSQPWPIGWTDKNISWGLTVTSMKEAEHLSRFEPWQLERMWVSFEPLKEDVRFWVFLHRRQRREGDGGKGPLAGAIVGHDRRADAPGAGQLAYVRNIVAQCDAMGIPVYVKQLWLRFDPGGRDITELPGMWGPKDRTELVRDVEKMPEDLRRRELPWGPAGSQGNNSQQPTANSQLPSERREATT